MLESKLRTSLHTTFLHKEIQFQGRSIFERKPLTSPPRIKSANFDELSLSDDEESSLTPSYNHRTKKSNNSGAQAIIFHGFV